MANAKVGKFRRNSAGVEQFLKTDPGVILLMHQAGDAVASAARTRANTITPRDGRPMPIAVETGISTWPGKADRYAAKVTVKHPAALPIEAKYGLLSESTTAAGLQWGRKSRSWGG
jgi:hypothetical protein